MQRLLCQYVATTPLPTEWAGLPGGLQQTLLGVIQALETKFNTGQGHSFRVAAYGTRLARVAGLAEADIPALRFGMLLHDIGKIAISDRILQKNGPLSPKEYRKVKVHPLVGVWLLRPVFHDVDPRILDVVLFHHERLDGTGYPYGLRGNEIPLWSRICSIVDAWDAMTSMRPYHSPFPVERAVGELHRGTSTQFDPELTTLFIDKVIPEITAAESI
jgi:HD-GYP domain-containing protein (c-di-GMP phosphodiesterase class II)